MRNCTTLRPEINTFIAGRRRDFQESDAWVRPNDLVPALYFLFREIGRVREDDSIRRLGAISFDALLRRCNPFNGGGNTFDLRDVRFISSAALIQLAAVAHGLAKRGDTLQLAVEDPSVRTYLARSGFLAVVQDIATIDPS